MDFEKLNKRIKKSGLKQEYIAEKLGISRQSLHKKLTGRSQFKQKEVFELSKLLHLSCEESMSIFFN